MKIRGIDFGPLWTASGACGWFGEGYWHSKILEKIPGYGWERATLVAKTTTLKPRTGNMPLDQNYQPIEKLPRCVYCGPWQWLMGMALNAVSLSGPGFKALLATGKWQKITEPFFLSFMSVAETKEGRINEFVLFVDELSSALRDFSAPIGLQVNLSCPNVGNGLSRQKYLVEEAQEYLGIKERAKLLSAVPLLFKLSVATTTPEQIKPVADDSRCDGLVVSNTIPYGSIVKNSLELDDWRWFFPSGKNSPLIRRGFSQPGGLSGKPLLPLTALWVRQARKLGFRCHLNAGGGILHKKDIDLLAEAGADSFFLGSVGFLRPWRLKKIIANAYSIKEGDD